MLSCVSAKSQQRTPPTRPTRTKPPPKRTKHRERQDRQDKQAAEGCENTTEGSAFIQCTRTTTLCNSTCSLAARLSLPSLCPSSPCSSPPCSSPKPQKPGMVLPCPCIWPSVPKPTSHARRSTRTFILTRPLRHLEPAGVYGLGVHEAWGTDRSTTARHPKGPRERVYLFRRYGNNVYPPDAPFGPHPPAWRAWALAPSLHPAQLALKGCPFLPRSCRCWSLRDRFLRSRCV